MIGTRLSHYKILEPLGAGGMGVVYRARDERLERDVAIKVLPPAALADEIARKRFRKEALALSRLNHPHIATVHDFDSFEGVDFLVMELVAGQTLSERIAEGPLPEAEVRRLGGQLAEGLAAAHRQGILHRDIKPGNLKVMPEGELKILDFGLAKVMRSLNELSGTETVSATGAVVGTLPYMSPEQLTAGTLDARSDVYSAGAVLYEMACGRKAFPQDSSPALVGAILGQSPTSPREICSGISADLELIVVRCLEKDPAHRYSDAGELERDLGRLTLPASPQRQLAEPMHPHRRVPRAAMIAAAFFLVTVAISFALNLGGIRDQVLGGGARTIQSLAVMPLANLSRDPDQEYFSDGITDELIQRLAGVTSLRVISRSSVMALKDSKDPPERIAQRLGVNHLVEGSVVRNGDRVRVRAELIRVKPERVLWARTYERGIRDLPSMQVDVAQAIAGEIQPRLTQAEGRRITRTLRVDPAAHEVYLRGVYFWHMRDSTRVQKALNYFLEAVRIDSTYAMGWAGVAQGYYAVSNLYLPPREAMPLCRGAAERALQLDPELSDAHAWLGVVLAQYEWNWSGAELEFRRAIELNPSQVDAHEFYGYLLFETAKLEDAVREYQAVETLDPLASDQGGSIAWCDYAAGHYDAAIAKLSNLVEIDPRYGDRRTWLGLCYLRKGMIDRALAELREGARLADHPWPLAQLGYAYALIGNRGEARIILNQLLRPGADGRRFSYGIALIYAALGERPHAIEWLEKGFANRDEDMLFLKVDPAWAPMRTDPGFESLLRRMNLES